MDDFGRTPDIARAALLQQHARASEEDPTVAPVGPPYWSGTGLVTTLGLLGEAARSREAEASRESTLLVIMARDPSDAVRRAVATNPATPRIISEALLGTGEYDLDSAEDIWGSVWAEEPEDVFRQTGRYDIDALRRSVEAGDEADIRFLNMLMARGFFARDYDDHERSRVWFRVAALAGSLEAIRMIGVAYEKEGDTSEAIEWLKRAIEVHPRAWLDLGRVYAGVGNTAEARRYLTPVAREGDPEAKALLASLGKTGGGCFIATAVYGDYDSAPVVTLRSFRDQTLATSRHGRALIRVYYAVSPKLADRLGDAPRARGMTRLLLDRFVRLLESRGYPDHSR